MNRRATETMDRNEYLPEDLIPTRASLLYRMRDWGDQKSWCDFYDTYWRLILKVALNSGLSQPEAEDVVPPPRDQAENRFALCCGGAVPGC